MTVHSKLQAGYLLSDVLVMLHKNNDHFANGV